MMSAGAPELAPGSSVRVVTAAKRARAHRAVQLALAGCHAERIGHVLACQEGRPDWRTRPIPLRTVRDLIATGCREDGIVIVDHGARNLQQRGRAQRAAFDRVAVANDRYRRQVRAFYAATPVGPRWWGKGAERPTLLPPGPHHHADAACVRLVAEELRARVLYHAINPHDAGEDDPPEYLERAAAELERIADELELGALHDRLASLRADLRVAASLGVIVPPGALLADKVAQAVKFAELAGALQRQLAGCDGDYTCDCDDCSRDRTRRHLRIAADRARAPSKTARGMVPGSRHAIRLPPPSDLTRELAIPGPAAKDRVSGGTWTRRPPEDQLAEITYPEQPLERERLAARRGAHPERWLVPPPEPTDGGRGGFNTDFSQIKTFTLPNPYESARVVDGWVVALPAGDGESWWPTLVTRHAQLRGAGTRSAHSKRIRKARVRYEEVVIFGDEDVWGSAELAAQNAAGKAIKAIRKGTPQPPVVR